MAGFKFELEQNLIIGCSGATMFAPDQLGTLATDATLAPAKIYMFASRPRIVVHEPEFEGFEAVLGPPSDPTIRIPLGGAKAFASANGQKVRLEDQHGEVAFEGRPSMLMQIVFQMHDDWDEDVVEAMRGFLDLDVLYVGKSDDEAGVVGGRLQSHSTLQKILASYTENHPDRELWVLAFVFDVTNTLGVLTAGDAKSDASIESRIPAQRPDLGQTQLNSLADWALIRYFAPEFNRQLKETFPSRSHKSYLDAVAFDYNSYGFVLWTEALLGVWLGSEKVSKAPRHEESFPIDGERDRTPLTM